MGCVQWVQSPANDRLSLLLLFLLLFQASSSAYQQLLGHQMAHAGPLSQTGPLSENALIELSPSLCDIVSHSSQVKSMSVLVKCHFRTLDFSCMTANSCRRLDTPIASDRTLGIHGAILRTHVNYDPPYDWPTGLVECP